MKKALGAKAKIGGWAGALQGKNGEQGAGSGRVSGRITQLARFVLDLPRFGCAGGGFWISFVRFSFATARVVTRGQ